jgi:F-type H+-transporting ATPase subunit b
MELITPGIGLLFWMLLMFSILLLILKKFAWKPILKALKDRETSIRDALMSADNAKKEMEKLKADNEVIMAEARAEKEKIVQEAKQLREKIIGDAKDEASEEAKKLLKSARVDIENEKIAAIQEVKNKVAELSIEIAEKILREKLADTAEQRSMIDRLVRDVMPN